MAGKQVEKISPKDFSVIMTAAGIGQNDVAERLGITIQSVNKTVNGGSAKPITVRKVVSVVCAMIEERAVSSLASAA